MASATWFNGARAGIGPTSSKEGLSSLLKDQRPLFTRGNWLASLLWIIVTATALVMYGRAFIHALLIMILLAIPLAAINGICEELLWRGLYVRLYPGSPWLGVIVPANGRQSRTALMARWPWLLRWHRSSLHFFREE